MGTIETNYYTNLVIKYRTENEVAFLFYAAVINLHSTATEIMNKKIERKMNEFECVILWLYWCQVYFKL